MASRPVDRGFGRMALKVISSGEKPVWPDGKHLNIVSSGERRVWPYGN